jgi:23S rRNA (adenine2030-N6)-methyltransferase
VFAVWHPVTERAQAEAIHRRIRLRFGRPTLAAELAVTADPQVRMKGCGLLVINPPWDFAGEVQALLPVLAKRLGADAGATSRLAWLVPEH